MADPLQHRLLDVPYDGEPGPAPKAPAPAVPELGSSPIARVVAAAEGEPLPQIVYEHRLLDVPYQGEPSPLEPPKAPKKPAAKRKPAAKKPAAKKAR